MGHYRSKHRPDGHWHKRYIPGDGRPDDPGDKKKIDDLIIEILRKRCSAASSEYCYCQNQDKVTTITCEEGTLLTIEIAPEDAERAGLTVVGNQITLTVSDESEVPVSLLVNATYVATDGQVTVTQQVVKTVSVGKCVICEVCICGGETIGFTSGTMASSSSQTLTVEGADAECDGTEYTWSASGGGSVSPSSGLSVTFTAPASVPEDCALEGMPGVQLLCKGSPVATKTFGLYDNGEQSGNLPTGVAARQSCISCSSRCEDGVPVATGCEGSGEWYGYRWDCFGNRADEAGTPGSGCWSYYSWGGNCEAPYPNCCGQFNPDNDWCGNNPCTGPYLAMTDIRTEGMIQQGCCPEILGN